MSVLTCSPRAEERARLNFKKVSSGCLNYSMREWSLPEMAVITNLQIFARTQGACGST